MGTLAISSLCLSQGTTWHSSGDDKRSNASNKEKTTSQGGALTGTPGAGQDTDEANVHGRNEEREKFSLLLNLIYSQISSLIQSLSQI